MNFKRKNWTSYYVCVWKKLSQQSAFLLAMLLCSIGETQPQISAYENSDFIPYTINYTGIDALKGWYADFDEGIWEKTLVGDEWILQIPDRDPCHAVITKKQIRGATISISGLIDGREDWLLSISSTGTVVSGHATIPSGETISWHHLNGNTVLSVAESLQSQDLSCETLIDTPNVLEQNRTKSSAGRGGRKIGEGTVGEETKQSTPTIRALIFMTENARGLLGGTDAAITAIENELAAAELPYQNSGTLVHFLATSYRVVQGEDFDTNTEILNLIGTGPEPIADVSFHRNQDLADIVLLFVGDGNLCGIATQLQSGSGNTQKAFAVISIQCFGTGTLAHEIGHIHGCSHYDEQTGIHPYSHSYNFIGNDQAQYRTIMDIRGGTRIPYFSDPTILFAGVPIGDATYSYNAKTVSQTAEIVANYRGNEPQSPGSISCQFGNASSKDFVGDLFFLLVICVFLCLKGNSRLVRRGSRHFHILLILTFVYPLVAIASDECDCDPTTPIPVFQPTSQLETYQAALAGCHWAIEETVKCGKPGCYEQLQGFLAQMRTLEGQIRDLGGTPDQLLIELPTSRDDFNKGGGDTGTQYRDTGKRNHGRGGSGPGNTSATPIQGGGEVIHFPGNEGNGVDAAPVADNWPAPPPISDIPELPLIAKEFTDMNMPKLPQWEVTPETAKQESGDSSPPTEASILPESSDEVSQTIADWLSNTLSLPSVRSPRESLYDAIASKGGADAANEMDFRLDAASSIFQLNLRQRINWASDTFSKWWERAQTGIQDQSN